MQPGAGKGKGSSFEREIGAALSLWLSNGERDDLITRTVISGGQFTQSIKSGNARGCAGDLMSADPRCNPFFNQFVIECKWWKDIDLYRLLFPRPTSKAENHELMAALLKVRQEAEKSNKPLWMLVARQNFQRTIAFVPTSPHLKSVLVTGEVAHHEIFDRSMMIFDFYTFLERVQPTTWLQYI
jgi:hypothetical protein